MTFFDVITHAIADLLGFTLAMLFAALSCRKQMRKKPGQPRAIYAPLSDLCKMIYEADAQSGDELPEPSRRLH